MPRAGDASAVPRGRAVSLALLAAVTTAVRTPDLGSAIAADILVRAAEGADLTGAWRLLQSSSFKKEWLTAAGRSGETPVQAAVRECRAELVGLIATHPEFDFKGFRKRRERRDLLDYVHNTSGCLTKDLLWAVNVLRVVQTSKPRQEELSEDPGLAAQDEECFFLPRPGEWFPLEGLDDTRLVEPEYPKFPEEDVNVLIRSRRYDEILTMASEDRLMVSGAALDMPILKKLWRLSIGLLHAARRGDERMYMERQLRSIGWSLFFRGARQAMNLHYILLSFATRRLKLADFPPEVVKKSNLTDEMVKRRYRPAADGLKLAWDRIGTWAVVRVNLSSAPIAER